MRKISIPHFYKNFTFINERYNITMEMISENTGIQLDTLNSISKESCSLTDEDLSSLVDYYNSTFISKDINEETKSPILPLDVEELVVTFSLEDIFENELQRTFSKNFRKYLELRGLTPKMLARVADVNIRSLYDFKKGKNCPNLPVMYRIARIFSTTVNDLITYHSDDENDNEKLFDLKKIVLSCPVELRPKLFEFADNLLIFYNKQ